MVMAWAVGGQQETAGIPAKLGTRCPVRSVSDCLASELILIIPKHRKACSGFLVTVCLCLVLSAPLKCSLVER